MDDQRIQDWRARQRIVAKMVDSAFNGDAPDEKSRIEFALITLLPNGDVSMIKNIDDPILYGAFLRIIAMHSDKVPDNDDEVVGHA